MTLNKATLLLLLALYASVCKGQSGDSASTPTQNLSPAANVASTGVNASLLFFPGPLQDFGNATFGQEAGCTASEILHFMTLTNMSVPVEELHRLTLKTWQAPNTLDAQIQNVTYLNLETGNIVVGNTVYDWNRRLTYFNYTLLTANIVDMPAYRDAVVLLNYTVGNLSSGGAESDYAHCQQPIPQLDSLGAYLAGVLDNNLSANANLEGGLRPTELKLPGGCISESSVNYAGDLLQSIRTGRTSQGDCCAACQNTTSCNVWVWCPSFGGCKYGENNSQTFPMYGCDLKHQDNLTNPEQLPAAYSRGPPTPFTSGRIVSSV